VDPEMASDMADLLFKLARPGLEFLDPERAHGVTIRALKLGFAHAPRRQPDDPILATSVWNLSFPNPVGLAAGFDKDAQVCDAALALGFGFVEAGTVTPRPQPGNPGQRLYRLAADEAVINRFGFNSRGIAPFAANLARRRKRAATGIVGANVGRNRDTADAAADYIACIDAVAGLADYLVVNISSPNTPGLRTLQGRAQIEDLLARVLESRRRAGPLPHAGTAYDKALSSPSPQSKSAVADFDPSLSAEVGNSRLRVGEGRGGGSWNDPRSRNNSATPTPDPSPQGGGAKERRPAICNTSAQPGEGRVGAPLLVKVGPDLDDAELRDIAQVALAAGVDGLIVGNTTLARPATLTSADRNAPGGLSGRPLFAPSTECLAAMYRFTQARIPLIGCGGIASGADAYAKIRAGASLVQLYSALVFHGPALVGRIKRELASALRKDGFASVRDAVGADHK
jgi:dihydroorotate dehydrogenase